jgi:hypothetical protein
MTVSRPFRTITDKSPSHRSARTALYNRLFARKMKGTSILRVGRYDTEPQRRNNPLDMEGMRCWTNKGRGPFYQMERLPTYTKHVDDLLERARLKSSANLKSWKKSVSLQ